MVILQPSYIPWRGYFHQIQKADVFVFYDDVQYDKHGWRNRNRIKTHQGPIWLTIPVHKKGVTVEHIPINQIELTEYGVEPKALGNHPAGIWESPTQALRPRSKIFTPASTATFPVSIST
jgi:hypothetical protein